MTFDAVGHVCVDMLLRIAFLPLLLVLVGSSQVALAEGPAPTPGIEMPLEERGPCSVITCKPLTPREREQLMREIELRKRLRRNADLRPSS